MISIKEIDHRELELCFELDSNTLSLWTKRQWETELNKLGVKVFAIIFEQKIIGISVVHTIIDEAQINYFSINRKFRRKGYGSCLMNFLIMHCEKLRIKKLFLEVSATNLVADIFYSKFNFITVGARKNYYRDGTDALLKEKNL